MTDLCFGIRANILKLGGTATWESWTAHTDGDSESHGWSDVGLDGYIRYILGIKALAAQFAHLQIMPLGFGPSLTSASGSLLTDRGLLAVALDRDATRYHMVVTIPVNVTATVYVPQAGGNDTTITVDGVNTSDTLTNGYLGVSGIGWGRPDFERVIDGR
jgi:alpha-L-rhamnosidase